ncbi:hypothetical protein LCGC14_1058050 [marine sediment metagenome]|uniref:Nudix hydrolase domain-containing protein n=1 Tax=marine sediment metagenome TaxID=412755 RepID=A0A0F9QSW1_9ZZZZ
MKKKFDYIVYIGRFQPFHNAHAEIVEEAQQLADRVILLIGSHNQPRTIENPWTTNERHEMIYQTLGWDSTGLTDYVADRRYNDQHWVKSVQNTVASLIEKDLNKRPRNDPLNQGYPERTKKPKIAIIGHKHDETSEYLEMFPQWEFIEVGSIDGVHATDIRAAYFDPQCPRGRRFWTPTCDGTLVDEANEFIKDHVPSVIFKHLISWRASNEYAYLDDQYQFIKNYDGSKYDPSYNTTDAVVIQSGHVLLVQRRAQPGKGLWALPGGFINRHERVIPAMLRELREETKLKVPEPVLKGSIKDSNVFDDPYRSLRGRTFTHAYLIELKDGVPPQEETK